jgi:hypothetical protein
VSCGSDSVDGLFNVSLFITTCSVDFHSGGFSLLEISGSEGADALNGCFSMCISKKYYLFKSCDITRERQIKQLPAGISVRAFLSISETLTESVPIPLNDGQFHTNNAIVYVVS